MMKNVWGCLLLLSLSLFAVNANSYGDDDWPVLTTYDADHLAKVALPIGGIGTGTVSLGGRGDLRDWEIMNRPAKNFTPRRDKIGPFFAIYCKSANGEPVARILEGPLDAALYEGSQGSPIYNHGFPRFAHASFSAAYPFGQVFLDDKQVPLKVTLQAFNPMIPADADASGLPTAILHYVLENPTGEPVEAAVCGSIPNFIGMDGLATEVNWEGNHSPTGCKQNRNEFRKGQNVQGIFMTSQGVKPTASQRGTMAITTDSKNTISYRTDWLPVQWGKHTLEFWDDFSGDGTLQDHPGQEDMPMASLAVQVTVPAKSKQTVTFYLTWHFPNRYAWEENETPENLVGNYYTTRWQDAWEVAEKIAPLIPDLEKKTRTFVNALCESDLPETVKEAALFNTSTLRTQTTFRIKDGKMMGWEGIHDHKGSCFGSCTHVWNYEQATAFLFGNLAKTMREIEFNYATDKQGMMSFRTSLPLDKATAFGKAAADGQMGCIMKMYRDWQLSGDDRLLKELWPHVKKALEFCWIKGGWDADQDGVMEGCQHNTMDVEYYGPNPQMGIWYLGALRSAEEMAAYLGDAKFEKTCHALFTKGSQWIDANLFNGEYYEHKVQAPKSKDDIAPSLIVGMGAADVSNPEYQLASGCLVDQLVGQLFAHVTGLGYLTKPEHVKKTLDSIMRYNLKEGFDDHFNCMRSYVLGDESALLMASYPKGRPVNPFPYFTEVMTGFEYAAAIGMLYEDQTQNGLQCIQNIRDRYDGKKRSPFDEAECGHHYARAMASWAAIPALTGFHYSGVKKSFTVSPKAGTYFWSNGYAYGKYSIQDDGKKKEAVITVLGGKLLMKEFHLEGYGKTMFSSAKEITEGNSLTITIKKER